MKKTNNLSGWIGWLKIGVVVVGIFAVIMVLLLLKTHSIQQELSSINNDVAYLQSYPKDSNENLTEKIEEKTAKDTEIENIINTTIDATVQETKIEQYEQTIDFLENEMVKYREFVEGEQEYLIRLISYCIAGIAAVLTFLGFKTRKEIQVIVQEQYKNQVEDEFSKCIGGTGNKEYLKYCIERERTAKNKKILFCYSEVDKYDDHGHFIPRYEEYERLYKMLGDQGYQVEIKKVNPEVFCEYQFNNFQVVVYMVSSSEICENQKLDNLNKQNLKNTEEITRCKGTIGTLFYNNLARYAKSNNIYCVLYTVMAPHLYFPEDVDKFNTSTANMGITLIDRVFSILYNIKI